ncbi:GNAT family N-acetyltransferase [uncultured Polaribacter sp.]|uniref:GNAT family N-acetyltransferase n=1 Tax=uncultured Polaribacter sp. TaxID=174711 RepID=UPI0026383687|nr:GNAT family N-acetyltransferase [uncultured Polaribacter sp.]
MNTFNFSTFPNLKTERLKIRQANFEDIKAVFDLRSSEEINKFVATKRVQNFDEAKDFIITCSEQYQKKKRVFWLIEFENKVIGSIVLHNVCLDNKYGEIGYKLKIAFQQKGLMTEAMQEVLKFGFKKMDLKTIEAFTHKNNMPSIALLEKHNFVFQSERRDRGFDDNRVWRIII